MRHFASPHDVSRPISLFDRISMRIDCYVACRMINRDMHERPMRRYVGMMPLYQRVKVAVGHQYFDDIPCQPNSQDASMLPLAARPMNYSHLQRRCIQSQAIPLE